MRKQYHFRRSGTGLDAWDVGRLIALSAGLEVSDVPIESIWEIDSVYWYDHGYEPTVRSIVEHARLIAHVDMSWPILLSHDGWVMDGMHRIARALLDGATTVRAVQFPAAVEPDFRNCRPDQLPYD